MDHKEWWVIIAMCLSCLLSNCSYNPDLKGETTGSTLGAAALGVSIANITSEVVALGTGIIAGSVLMGIIGQDYDSHSPLQLEDPINDHIPLYYYKTLRAPLVAEYFFPGEIIPPPKGHPKSNSTISG